MQNDRSIIASYFGIPVDERDLLVCVQMLNAAKTNFALQDLLDRAKVIYYLSKKDGT